MCSSVVICVHSEFPLGTTFVSSVVFVTSAVVICLLHVANDRLAQCHHRAQTGLPKQKPQWSLPLNVGVEGLLARWLYWGYVARFSENISMAV